MTGLRRFIGNTARPWHRDDYRGTGVVQPRIQGKIPLQGWLPDGEHPLPKRFPSPLTPVARRPAQSGQRGGGDTGIPGAEEQSPVLRDGAAADESGRYLLIVDVATGGLYRIATAPDSADPIRKVTMRGGDLKAGNGLDLRGNTPWAAQNTSNTTSRWKVADDGAAADLERTVIDESLCIPTTLVRADTEPWSSPRNSIRAGRWGLEPPPLRSRPDGRRNLISDKYRKLTDYHRYIPGSPNIEPTEMPHLRNGAA